MAQTTQTPGKMQFALIGAVLIVALILAVRGKSSTPQPMPTPKVEPVQMPTTTTGAEAQAPAPTSTVDRALEPSAGEPAFIATLQPAKGQLLAVKDLPGALMYPGRWMRANGRYYAVTDNRLAVYDADGKLTAVNNTAIVPCAQNILIVGDMLYAACWSDGVYGISLKKNAVVQKIDERSGLTNLLNLNFAHDGTALWIGTYNGAGRVDPTSGKVRMYTKELGVPGMMSQVRVHAAQGAAWAEVIASAESVGGASRYIPSEDRWVAYTPQDLKAKDKSRIDINAFFVSPSGTLLTYQDGGPDNIRKARFDNATEKWSFAKISMSDDDKLRAPDELPFKLAQYTAVSQKTQYGYFMLHGSRLEQLDEQDAFPRPVATFSKIDLRSQEAEIVATPDGKAVIVVSGWFNLMGGDSGTASLSVYDPKTGEAFQVKTDKEVEGIDLGDISVAVDGDLVTVSSTSIGTQTVDLVKKVLVTPAAP